QPVEERPGLERLVGRPGGGGGGRRGRLRDRQRDVGGDPVAVRAHRGPRAAGAVGSAIGSETWGSILSPCTRTGASGLRPTFGRVSRHGAMALSWSMDKLGPSRPSRQGRTRRPRPKALAWNQDKPGPIARSLEDCALVLAAIPGTDGHDGTVVDAPFDW